MHANNKRMSTTEIILMVHTQKMVTHILPHLGIWDFNIPLSIILRKLSKKETCDPCLTLYTYVY